MDKKNKAKLNQFPYKLMIISSNEIDFFINYVKEKYQIGYLPELYENSEKYKRENFSKIRKEEKINLRINQIKESDIDFSKNGWITKASNLTGISRNRIRKWLKDNIPDLIVK